MKFAQFNRFGDPATVVMAMDAPEPDAPGPGEVVVDIEIFPINPVDLLTIAGKYAVRPLLPAIPGSEALGRVTSVGEDVSHVAPGQRVLMMGRENWMQRKRVPAAEVLPVPADADPMQLAMLKINPATALLMLTEYCALQSGDWLLQNAANSGVGRCMIQLAGARGIRTVNVVRRQDAVAPLKELGADVVLVDGPDLAERVSQETGGADIRLATDAVAGEETGRIAECLCEGGTIVSYGLLSGKPCTVDPYQVVFRQITLTGFWLVNYLGAMSEQEKISLYGGLTDSLVDGALCVSVEAVYPLDEIQTALAHAAKDGRGGKVLVAPNGLP